MRSVAALAWTAHLGEAAVRRGDHRRATPGSGNTAGPCAVHGGPWPEKRRRSQSKPSPIGSSRPAKNG
jgi:hypothetical protein